MPADPQILFFDAAGTLIHLPLSVGEHYRTVALRFGIAPEAAAVDKAFRRAWKRAPARVSTVGPRPDDDKGWWRDLVVQVLDEVLPAPEKRHLDQEAYFEAVYAHFAEPGVWAAYADVHGALASLREAGYRLGVISNFDRRLRKVLTDLGLTPYFDHIVLSSEIGADKPDPRIFQAALDLFGAAPHEAWHIGDDPQKDWGATAAGLRVFPLERPRHTLHDVLPYVRAAAGA